MPAEEGEKKKDDRIRDLETKLLKEKEVVKKTKGLKKFTKLMKKKSMKKNTRKNMMMRSTMSMMRILVIWKIQIMSLRLFD